MNDLLTVPPSSAMQLEEFVPARIYSPLDSKRKRFFTAPVQSPTPTHKRARLAETFKSPHDSDKQDLCRQDFHALRTLQKTNLGKVILAQKKCTGEVVILKLSRPSPDSIEDPVGESKLLQGLHHENLVSCLGEFTSPRGHYQVLEFAQKGDLLHRLSTSAGNKLPKPEARRILRAVATALQYLHENGICHLDVSVENVLLDAADTPKLADLGAARSFLAGQPFPPAQSLAERRGKSQYMSPEVFFGKAFLGDKADVWSLGAVLYAMTFGVMLPDGLPEADLFEDDNAPAPRRKLLAGDLLGMLSDYGLSSDDAELLDLLQHMLDPDPRTRYTVSQVLRHSWLQ